MRVIFTRLSIVVTLIGAVLGLAISLYGLYAVWTIQPNLNQSLTELVGIASQTLEASSGMLTVMSSSLDQAGQDLALVRDILDSTGQTISQSTGMVDETAKLMGEQMPQFIANTQKALEGAQATARLMDDTLGTITSIPLIGPSLGQRYRPEVPLNESIAEINRSLDPLPKSFTTIQNDMKSSSASMATVQGEIETLSKQVGEIETSLANAKREVNQYQLTLASVQDRLDKVEKQVPVYLNMACLALTVVLIWLGISQVGSLMLVFELYRQRVDA